MNVSIDETKWNEDSFMKHKEGIENIDGDKIFRFTYYQWCAFFSLLQV